MSEETKQEKKTQKYQWIKGENHGTVEEVKENKDGFVYFTSGRRINANLMDEFLMKVNSDAEILDTNPKQATQSNTQKDTNKEQPKQSKQKKEKENPLKQLLKKQSDRNQTDITINFNVKVPKKEVIDILQDSFDDDVIETVISNVLDELKNNNTRFDEIKDSVRKSILRYYDVNESENNTVEYDL